MKFSELHKIRNNQKWLSKNPCMPDIEMEEDVFFKEHFYDGNYNIIKEHFVGHMYR